MDGRYRVTAVPLDVAYFIPDLTGTLLGGYADDLFNTLFRLEAARMKEHGYEWGTSGRSSFTQDYGNGNA